MRRVHLVRAALTAALLSAFSLVAGPAGAGGPTSVLLSVPGAGSTASLYYTDPEYDDLAGLVGIAEPGGHFEKSSGAGHEFGPGVTVTWLIHDVDPWRIDRIYLGGKDGPWISTQVVTDTSRSIWQTPVVWHQPADAQRLADLLNRLGVGAAAMDGSDFEGVAGATVPDLAADTAAEPTPAAEPTDVAGAWWGLGGLTVGVLLMLAWTRFRRRPDGAREDGEPRTGSAGLADELVP
ncbi:MAG: hypothetical protein ACRDVZ_05180 [Jiangellaceae bacterium]